MQEKKGGEKEEDPIQASFFFSPSSQSFLKTDVPLILFFLMRAEILTFSLSNFEIFLPSSPPDTNAQVPFPLNQRWGTNNENNTNEDSKETTCPSYHPQPSVHKHVSGWTTKKKTNNKQQNKHLDFFNEQKTVHNRPPIVSSSL